jgi:formylglycine-generating enzyme required for sulfatase activity
VNPRRRVPGAPLQNLVAGAVVFSPPDHGVPLNDHLQWWSYVKGANWRHPDGPDSNLRGREHYPVVQIAYDDAVAYATWGDEFTPSHRVMANTHQGHFPDSDDGEDGSRGIGPVAQFERKYRPDYYAKLASAGGVARNPRGPDTAFDPSEPNVQKRVHRGGSFLCTDQYCSRYMVGTRGKGESSTGTNHVGLRLVKLP